MYAARLLPQLVAAGADVTAFSTDDAAGPDGVPVRPLAQLEVVEHIERPFDHLLYMLGNSEAHLAEEFHHRVRRHGSVLLHDARLVGLYRQMAEWGPHLLPDPAGLVPTLHAMYPGRYEPWVPADGPPGAPLDGELVDRLGILMARAAVDVADRVLVHSAHAADLVEWDTGRRPDVAFPLPAPRLDAFERRVEDDLVVSLGVVSPAKHSDRLVEAVAALPGVRLALVGPVDDAYRRTVEGLADRLGVRDRVVLTGRVATEEYWAWLSRARVVVQLRAFSNGESSGSAAEVLAAGVPLVVNDIGTFRELPVDVVRHVTPGADVAEVAAAVAALLADDALSASLSAAAVRHSERIGYDAAARRLLDLLFG